MKKNILNMMVQQTVHLLCDRSFEIMTRLVVDAFLSCQISVYSEHRFTVKPLLSEHRRDF